MISRINYLFKQNEFVRHFVIFFTGTLFAQIFTIIASPFLTRIYSPSIFGAFGFYTASIALLITLTTGRFEFAINTVKEKEETYFLYKAVSYISLFFSLFLSIVILLFKEKLNVLFNVQDPYLLFFIPVTLFLFGVLQGSSYVLNKEKDFKSLSKAKLFKSVTTAIVSFCFGFLILKSYGLIIGYIAGIFMALVFQSIKIKRYFEVGYQTLDIRSGVMNVVRKFKHYPLFNAPSAFFDALAGQVPLFVMMKIYSHDVVGFYSLTIMVISGPLSLIAVSMSQVFLSQISQLNRDGKKFKYLVIKIVKILCLCGIFPILILVFWGPQVFSFVFGARWAVSGEFTRYVALGNFIGFVVSPLSMVFYIKQKVKTLSVIQTIRAITTTTLFILVPHFLGIEGVLLVYTLHESVFYSIYLYFILKISN